GVEVEPHLITGGGWHAPLAGKRRSRATLLAVAAGCALSGRRSVPAPASALSAAPPQGVRVVLLWAAPVDLDLYVTDPGLETVYFANTPSGSGGKLVRDLACGQLTETTPTTFSEEVVWTKAHPGRYRLGVDFSDTCRR